LGSALRVYSRSEAVRFGLRAGQKRSQAMPETVMIL